MDSRVAIIFLLTLTHLLYALPKKNATKNSTIIKPKCYGYTCGEKEHTLSITCRAECVNFMTKLENTLIQTHQFDDPTSCFYNSFDDIEEVDFIVVGAGISGAVVAGRLAENPDWTVMLLEAGEAAPAGSQPPAMYFNYHQDGEFDWNYNLLPQDNVCLSTYGICTYPRGKVVGGTGILHGMMYMRGNPADYDMLSQDGIEGWTWNDVFPYFLKSENNLDINSSWIDRAYHSVGGPLTISQFNDHPAFAENLLAGWQELGYKINVDCNGKSQFGFMIAQATNVNGTREATTKAYVFPKLKEKGNLFVLPKATVYQIIIDETTKVATGVLYNRNGVDRIVRVRKEIIVTAGTIATPQLLLLSGLGPKEHLDAVGVKVIQDMPGVGHNLNNHVSTEIFFRVHNDSNLQLMNDDTIHQYLTNRTGPLSSTGMSQLTGFIKTNESDPDPRPDLQIFHAGYTANCSRTGLLEETVSNGDRIFSISPTLIRTKSVGYVQLRNQFPLTKPIVYGGILTEEEDVKLLMDSIKITLRILNTTAMQEKGVYLDPTPTKGCQNYTFASEEYWRCYVAYNTNPENHQVGTARMGAVNDTHAVTDSKLRVIGIKNLRIGDASVFPRTPSGNLQGPAIMVAERAASFINDTWFEKKSSTTEEYLASITLHH